MLVEMVDGGLTWRGDREEGVSDAQRKQHILKRKQMALEDPSQWLTANMRLPGEQQRRHEHADLHERGLKQTQLQAGVGGCQCEEE